MVYAVYNLVAIYSYIYIYVITIYMPHYMKVRPFSDALLLIDMHIAIAINSYSI